MAITGRSRPSMAAIARAQNGDDNLRSQLAAKRFYSRAKWLDFGGASLTIAFALTSPFVLLFVPDAGPLLGAAAGTWIFVSRLILDPVRCELQLKGATAQERFDCAVLGIDWNESLARRLPDEELSAASRAPKRIDDARDWYPTPGELAWPKSVLVCQRANAVWARRQHRAYARAVGAAAVGWGAVGVFVAIADSASLAEYLVTVALPSLPAFLDATELARRHAATAESRQVLEAQADGLLQSGNATEHDLRDIQDQLFNLRREAPLVPQWFYRIIRADYEADMRYAAQRTVELNKIGAADNDGTS